MESTLEYLTRMNKILLEDSKDPERFRRHNCFGLAREVERRLKLEGKNPELYFVKSGHKINEEGELDCIIPKPYEGRIKDWRVHVVAVADDFVFDPMLGRPISIDTYCRTAFVGRTKIKPCKFYGASKK